MPRRTLAFFRARELAAEEAAVVAAAGEAAEAGVGQEVAAEGLAGVAAAPPPTPLSARLLPFQRQGIAQMLRWRGRALLADEPGLGKTLHPMKP